MVQSSCRRLYSMVQASYSYSYSCVQFSYQSYHKQHSELHVNDFKISSYAIIDIVISVLVRNTKAYNTMYWRVVIYLEICNPRF